MVTKSFPLDGITRKPYGLPLMMPAWLGCISWAITQDDCLEQFQRDTGLDIRSLRCSPIEAMIDEATGRRRAMFVAWCDWVTVNLWGEE